MFWRLSILICLYLFPLGPEATEYAVTLFANRELLDSCTMFILQPVHNYTRLS